MKIIICLANKLSSFRGWIRSKDETNRASAVVNAVGNLPQNQMQKFLDTGEAEVKLGEETLKITPLRESVLERIREACSNEGYADQDEIINYFAKNYGRRIKPFVGEEIYGLLKLGVITREQRGEIFCLKLSGNQQ